MADAKHKGGYRSNDEIEAYKRDHDPIQLFKRRLIAEGILTEEEFDQLSEQAKGEARASVQFADDSPLPRGTLDDMTMSRPGMSAPRWLRAQSTPSGYLAQLANCWPCHAGRSSILATTSRPRLVERARTPGPGVRRAATKVARSMAKGKARPSL